MEQNNVCQLQPKAKKVATGIYLEEELLEKVKSIAGKANLSTSNTLAQLVEMSVDRIYGETK